jgi:hypothetical protein
MARRTYEVEHVQPTAAQWLTDHGYQYEREKRLIVGRVDFYAWNNQGDQLLVECKIGATNLKGTIQQLVSYIHQVKGNVRAAVAMPAAAVNKGVIRQCGLSGLSVIPLDVAIPETVKLSILLPEGLYETLRYLAYQYNVSFGELVRHIIATDPAIRKAAETLGVDLSEYQQLRREVKAK